MSTLRLQKKKVCVPKTRVCVRCPASKTHFHILQNSIIHIAYCAGVCGQIGGREGGRDGRRGREGEGGSEEEKEEAEEEEDEEHRSVKEYIEVYRTI